MNKMYKADKIYIVKLAEVTKVDDGQGYNARNFKMLPQVHFAKLVKTEIEAEKNVNHFKLLVTKKEVSDDYMSAEMSEEVVIEKSPLNTALGTDYKFVSYKDMAKAEREMISSGIQPTFVTTENGKELI